MFALDTLGDLVGRYAYLGVFSPSVELVKGAGVVCVCRRAFPVVVVQRQTLVGKALAWLLAASVCVCVCM